MTTPVPTSLDLNRRTLLAAGGATAALAVGAAGRARAADARTDVIVIGAGLSGLNAALLLESQGAKVTVLEGRKRIGGRLLTLDDVPGHPEAGGNGIGAGYARILDIAKRTNTGLMPVRRRTESTEGSSVINIGGTNILQKDWAASRLNPFPADRRAVMPWDYQWSVFAKANPLKPGDSWIDPKFAPYDISGFDLMRQKGETEPVIDLAVGVGSVYGTNVYDFSMLAVFHSLRWGAEQASFGPGAFAVKGGNQRLPEAMARTVKGRIEMGKIVRAVSTDANGVEVRCDDGTSYRARAAVMTLPFPVMRSMRFDPVLTGPQAEAVQLLGYSTAFQVHFAVKRPYWKEDGLPPDMWTDGPVGKLAALRYAENPDEITTVLAYVNGAQGERLDRLPPEAATGEMLDFLARARPSTKGALQPVKVISWQRDPFSGAVYCAYKPGQITRYAEKMATPHGWVHFAGEHTAIVNRGMEGAMESGERAAGEVLARL